MEKSIEIDDRNDFYSERSTTKIVTPNGKVIGRCESVLHLHGRMGSGRAHCQVCGKLIETSQIQVNHRAGFNSDNNYHLSCFKRGLSNDIAFAIHEAKR